MIGIKILIVGSVASGKTTLAKRLSLDSNINYYEIDSIVYDDENKRKRSILEQDEIIKKINNNGDWIIEGTLRENLYYLLNYADKIIYLDISKYVRKRRIFIRFIKQKIGIEKCNYKSTINMLRMMYVWTNKFERNKGHFENMLNKYVDKLIRLCSLDDINNYNL